MMIWIRSNCPLDTGFEIRTLAVWRWARYLSVMEAPVIHTMFEWSLRVSEKERFFSLKPECQSRGRTRDFSIFQADRFITTVSANCSNWEYTNSKERLAQMSIKNPENKRDHFSCCNQVLSEAMGSVLILITPYDSELSNRTCAMLDFQIHYMTKFNCTLDKPRSLKSESSQSQHETTGMFLCAYTCYMYSKSCIVASVKEARH